MSSVAELGREIVSTFVEMAPYLLLGLTFAGILHVVFKRSFVVRHLGGGTVVDSFKAAVLGVPLPLCSCGVVPTAMSLRKSKASDGATVSFLISTPQTGIDSIIATYGILGPLIAVFRPVAAFVMGVTGGIITTALGGRTTAPREGRTDEPPAACSVCAAPAEHAHTWGEKIVAMAKYAYGEFLDDISVQLVAGIAISGLISWLLPPDFFTRTIDNELLAMLLMIVGGIPLYVCATASIPIAAALMMKGLSPGAAFVFLAVGPATNAATVTVIAGVMGKKIVAVYLGVISVLSVAAGFALNGLFALVGTEGTMRHIAHQHGEEGIGPISIVLAIAFLVLLLLSLWRKYLPSLWRRVFPAPAPAVAGPAVTVSVEGMTCHKCAAHVTDSIRAVPGVREVHVDLAGKKAVVSGEAAVDDLRRAIESAGYKAVGAERSDADGNGTA